MYKRVLKLSELLKKRSYFLFGPRATGKSTLIQKELPHAQVYDLLDSRTFLRLSRNPKLLEEETEAKTLVVIDEIQKLPALLDEVHRLIFKRKQVFLLTGSSARKLRKGGSNLLAGRAFQSELFPLTSQEIPQFDLLTYLNTTGLPEFYGDPQVSEFLDAYIGTYLKVEIQAESLVRNLSGYSRFLEVVASANGEEINLAGLSSDSGVPVKTLENYFSILNDTLIGFPIAPFQGAKHRKAITRSKYYLFDVGVVNRLTQRGRIELKSELFGRAFEHWIALELRAYLSYRKVQASLQYWRTTSQFEVDFILAPWIAIEVKATDLVTDRHLKGLRALKEEQLIQKYIVVSLDQNLRQTADGIQIMPWKLFIQMLWNQELV